MFRYGQFDRDRLRSCPAGPMTLETYTHMRLHASSMNLFPERADPEAGPSLRRLLAADAVVTHFQPIFSQFAREASWVWKPSPAGNRRTAG